MARKREHSEKGGEERFGEEAGFGRERRVSRWFYVFLLVVIAFALFIIFQPKPGRVIPDDSNDPMDLPDFDENMEIPHDKLTAVTLSYNTLAFASDEHRIMFVPFFMGTAFEDAFVFDMNEYIAAVDRENSRFMLESEFGEHIGTYSFVPGKASDTAIEFQPGVKYRYFVPVEGNSVYFLLEKQEFALQFGKTFWFEGTDTRDRGTVDAEYFMPDLDVFGGNAYDGSYSVAVLSFDGDEDGKAEIRAFVDCSEMWILDSLKEYDSYNDQTEFLQGGKWTGYSESEEGEKTTSTAKIVIAPMNFEVNLFED